MTPPVPALPVHGQCDYCTKPLPPPPKSAPHKRFCDDACRNSWHRQRRKQALAQLEATETAQVVEAIKHPKLGDL